jgi:alpha-galactosidase
VRIRLRIRTTPRASRQAAPGANAQPAPQAGRAKPRPRRFLSTVTGLALIAAGLPAASMTVLATSAAPAYALDNGLALTPPMGFNDWNAYHCGVSASLIEQTAKAMHTDGMQAAGYKYVNVDDCWLASTRAANGQLQANPTTFPQGIKPVADYVHSLGLKFGIYEDAGTSTCAGYPGSYGHYAQDAQAFASWGVDYLKLDWCNLPFQDFPGQTHQQVAQKLYSQMRDALAATGRPIMFSMCNGWDSAVQPQTWAQPVANLWRTTNDISDSFGSMLSNFTQNVQYWPDARPGAWNDPDMLEVGNGGMTTAEYQAEFSLWAEMAAPLIAGTNLTTMTATTRSIYTNRSVIAVDQDPLGKQGRPVVDSNGDWVLTKPLANGDRAVVLFNQNPSAAAISATAAQVGFTPPAHGRQTYQLTDLWTGQRYETTGTIAANVPAHAAVMYLVAPTSHPSAAAPLVVTGFTAGTSATGTWLPPGQPAGLQATVTNYGAETATDVRIGWTQVPAGWQVTPSGSGPAPGSAIAPGHRATYSWAVTPPATNAQPIGTAQLTLGTSYSGGRPRSSPPVRSSVSVAFNVVYSPVQAPDQTYSSATDAPAHFGQIGQQFAIDAAGSDVWVGADNYGAIYQKGVVGTTSTVQTEVTSQQNVSGFAKAGIIVRNDVAGSGTSPEGVILYESPEDGIQLGWNDNGGTYIDNQTPNIAAIPDTTPVWLRLVRNGSTYTGYYSTNGSTWQEVGSETLSGQTTTQDAGLFLSSHATGNPGLVYYNGFKVS